MIVVLVIVAICMDSTSRGDAYGFRDRCGPNAVEIVARSLLFAVEQPKVASHSEKSSLGDLRATARSIGLAAEYANWNIQTPEFRFGKCGAVIAVSTSAGQNHFVAVLENRRGQFLIADFPSTPYWIDATVLKSRGGWNGVALVVAKSTGDIPHDIGDFAFQSAVSILGILSVSAFCFRFFRFRLHRGNPSVQQE